jgi:hypothetical protein
MNSRLPQIRLEFDSADAMQAEYQRNLRAGGAFCPGAEGYPERSACLLVLAHTATGAALELPAEVVFVRTDEPGKGVGVHIQDFGPAVQQKLLAFIESLATPPAPPEQLQPVDVEQEAPAAALAAETPAQKLAATALHERLRGLSTAAQLKLAREGNITERVALERIFGKAVWEAILQNQRVSPPEVARISRMGTASIAILETIVGNSAWLASGEVRRALLSNPRLAEEGVMRVLRAMPKPELQQVSNQTSYQPRVRKAAKTILGRG